MKIRKFGGTSVGSIENLRNIVDIVKSEYGNDKQLIVVSAFGGITDQLLGLIDISIAGKQQDLEKAIEKIKERHLETIDELCKGEYKEVAKRFFEELAIMIEELLQGVIFLQECTEKTKDRILSFGELASAYIVSQILNSHGINSDFIDARNFIYTDDDFGNAKVDFESTKENFKDYTFTKDNVDVMTGFIASSPDGETTTLGRGGSDYTASIVGAILNVNEIQIWTDVDGVLTADPRIIKNAKILTNITYQEAAEMSYFGARVLHPKTMIPAIKAKIPLRIKNTLNPTAPGTIIEKEVSMEEDWHGVKVVTAIKDLALVTIEGNGMIGLPGIAGKVFTATARAKSNVIMFSQASSEHNISLIMSSVDANNAKKELEKEFELELHRHDLDEINIRTNVAVLAAVRNGTSNVPGVSAKLFGALASKQINIITIAQCASEMNISVVIDEDQIDNAVQVVHEIFDLGN